MLSRLPAVTQTSRSSWPVAHSRVANAAARWVLPVPPGPAGSPGPRITVFPGRRGGEERGVRVAQRRVGGELVADPGGGPAERDRPDDRRPEREAEVAEH